jgi:hypothetical protein
MSRKFYVLMLALTFVVLNVYGAVTVTVNGSNYSIPQTNERGWGSAVTSWIQAISSNTLQPSGGAFTLTADADFGASFGLKSSYLSSRTANPSTSGLLRLAKTDSIGWRNNANSGNLLLSLDGSDNLTFNGSILATASSGSFADNGFNLYDNADATKKIAFQASGITAGTTRTLTMPDADVNLGALTNSNISGSAAIDYSKLNLTGSLVNADVSGTANIARNKLASGAANRLAVNDGSGVLSDASAITASRALVSDANGIPTHSSVTTTELGYVSGVTSSIQTQLDAKAPSNSPTLTTPTADVVTLDGQASAPANPSAGNFKLYVSDTTSKLTLLDSNGTATSVGAGGTGTNFITNGDAEAGTTGWSVYKDASATSPADGTGTTGATAVTITASSTNPLAGSKSFVISKGASDLRGEGVGYDFTIDAANKARVQSIKFDYIVNSGTFTAGTSSTDSDVTVWIYDVTNSTLIQPSSYKLLSNSSTVSDQFQAEFQTSSNSTSFRLIFHIASTSASAYELKIENIQVGPSAYVYGTPISDWASYTPTFTGFGTVGTQSFEYRRVGSNIEIRGRFVTGTNTATEARISLPSGLTSSSSIATIAIAGNLGSSTTIAGAAYVTIEPSVTYLTISYTSAGTSGLTKQNGNTFSAGTTLQVNASLPVAGFSSSVQMSDSTSTRIVSSYYYKSGGLVGAGAIVPSYSSGSDTHNAFDMATGIFTVPVAGDYDVSAGISCNLAGIIIGAALNGNTQFQSATSTNGTVGFSGKLRNLKAGDQISIINMTASSITVTSNNFSTYLSITRVSGPSQIAASETVAARYKTSGQSIPNATTTIVNFATSDFDTHSAVTTGASWKFTAQISGTYRVSAQLQWTSANYNANSLFESIVYKNGSSYSSIGYTHKETNTANIAPTVIGSTLIQLNAGDYVDVRAYQNTGADVALSASNGYNWVSVERIGNR